MSTQEVNVQSVAASSGEINTDDLSAIRDLVFGSAAGMIAKVFEHPFDLVKVRLQSQPTDRPASFTGPLDCFKQTVKGEGFRGLYRGLTPPIIGAAMENATLFFVYNRCQAGIVALRAANDRARPLTIPELALAGAGAGAVTSFVLTPIELIKCRMQVQMLAVDGSSPNTSHGNVVLKTSMEAPASPSSSFTIPASMAKTGGAPKGPLALIADTVRTSGIRGLWLGQSGTFLRETGGGAAWFGMYELVAKTFVSRHQARARATSDPEYLSSKADLPAWQLCVAGAAAGVSYIVSLFPADCIKSTIQTYAELNPNKPVPGFVETGMDIFRTRGIRGLYAGCALTCLRSGPSSAMIFGLFETFTTQLGWMFERKQKPVERLA